MVWRDPRAHVQHGLDLDVRRAEGERRHRRPDQAHRVEAIGDGRLELVSHLVRVRVRVKVRVRVHLAPVGLVRVRVRVRVKVRVRVRVGVMVRVRVSG